MKFERRTEAPSKTNKFYLHTPKGYNKCIRIKGDECIPNCTGYAYGRFMEAQNITKCDLPTSNAELWYKNYKGKKGKKAKLGSVVVWKQGDYKASDGMGHVEYLEHLYPDGTFDTTSSAYNGRRWYTKHYDANGYRKGYELEGYIYPLVDFDEDKWELGKYRVLYHKYLRSTPEVKSNNKVKYKNLIDKAKAKCIKDKLGYAKYKIDAEIDIKEFKTDSKGNVWGRTNTLWVCVEDKTGKQVIKV